MTLIPGLRIAGAAGAEYEVGPLAWASPRREFVRARKVFRNFRYPASSLDEAGPDEWLDVLIRRPLGPLDAAGEPWPLERDEVFTIVPAPWLLEPLDVIEPGPGDAGPLLVLADPHAERLDGGPPDVAADLDRRIRLAMEVLDMLEAFHERSLAADGLDPGDVLMDGTGRWFYAGTDRVRRADPSEGFRADLAEWARLAARIVGGMDRLDGPDADRVGPGRVLADWIRRCGQDGRHGAATVRELRTGRRPARGLLDLLRPRPRR